VAKVIEIYVPDNFRKTVKWVPPERSRKVIEFTSLIQKSADKGYVRDHGLIAVENEARQIKAPLKTIDLQAPESLRQLIELQIEMLSAEELRALELTSLTGVSFRAHADALTTSLDREEAENLCE
jgi:hypothetical protein